jgi:D-xylonolactonase
MATGETPGRLYRLDPDRSIRVVQEGVGCSNGMGFAPDLQRMYHTDSFRHEIYLYDYDRASGEINNRRLFAKLPAELGFPDGMTVDAEGCVWSAVWDGACVLRFDPAGKELVRLEVPAKKASSVIFAGTDYSDLYVTTAGGDKKAAEDPLAGTLFRLRGAGNGVPEFLSRF